MSDQTPPADGPPPPPPPYGAPPPPPPPPSGPGGYGPPAPPPPPPSYGAPQTGAGGYSAPDAISYGWAKFRQKPADLLVPVLAIGILFIVLIGVIEVIVAHSLYSTHDCTKVIFGQSVQTKCSASGLSVRLGAGLLSLVVGLLGQIFAAALVKGALATADGQGFTFGSLFEGWDKAQVVTAGVIIGVANLIGGLIFGQALFFVPELVIGFLTTWTVFFIVDKHQGGVEAIRSSVSFSTAHLSDTIVFYLLALAVSLVGACLCGVGLLVAIPVVLVGAAYTFRALHGEPVTPAA